MGRPARIFPIVGLGIPPLRTPPQVTGGTAQGLTSSSSQVVQVPVPGRRRCRHRMTTRRSATSSIFRGPSCSCFAGHCDPFASAINALSLFWLRLMADVPDEIGARQLGTVQCVVDHVSHFGVYWRLMGLSKGSPVNYRSPLKRPYGVGIR